MLQRFSRAASLLSVVAASVISFRATAAPILAVDVNARSAPTNTQPNYSVFTMSTASGTSAALQSQTVAYNLNNYNVSVIAFDDGQDEDNVKAGNQLTTGTLDDRNRAPSPAATTTLTNAPIYQDFIFAPASDGPTGGMDLKISGGLMQANTAYNVSIYSFDSGSNTAPHRGANWYDANNSGALVLSTLFTGSLPANNGSYEFTGTAMTDGNGQLSLQGRDTSGYQASGPAAPGVFLNGFEISATPEPGSISLLAIASLVATRRGKRK